MTYYTQFQLFRQVPIYHNLTIDITSIIMYNRNKKRIKRAKMPKDKLTTRERQMEALRLRQDAISYQEIADTLGYKSVSGAYKAVMSQLDRLMREPADKVRHLELTRIDRLYNIALKAATGGNIAAIDRCIRLMERRARLKGLDAPTTHKHEVVTWKDKVIDLIKERKVSFSDLAIEVGDESLAISLFKQAGVKVEVDS